MNTPARDEGGRAMPTLTELSGRLRSGSTDAVAALEDSLALIAKYDPSIHAFTALNPRAHEEAALSAARWKAGSQLSEIDGVPFAVKDNMLTAGVTSTWGSRVYEQLVPTEDELPIARLRAAGAVLVGKTNTPEFAALGTTRNSVFAQTANPWDLSTTPGGSSGGSAAAVAAGLVPFALGTDGGGSTRRPAALTGIVGFKPSVGRVPRSGGFPYLMHDLEVIGPMARRVRDIQLLMPILSPPHPSDQSSWAFQEWDGQLVAPTLSVGIVEQIGNGPVSPEQLSAAHRAGAALSILGHAAQDLVVRLDLEEIASWSAPFMQRGLYEIAATHPSFHESVEERFSLLAISGEKVTSEVLEKSLDNILQFRATLDDLFRGCDIIVCPSTAAQPWDNTLDFPPQIDGRPASPRDHAAFSGWVNAAGLPAVSIPVGFDSEGMPLGVQLIGRAGTDETILALAAALEDHLCVADPRLSHPEEEVIERLNARMI
ncbi:MAG: putative amidase [Glaciihabitans sp.]|nr:putative amidase [Glaciihabitans sp.]